MSKNKRNTMPNGEKKRVSKDAVFKLLTLIFITGGIFALYRILITFPLVEPVIFWVYLVGLTVCVAAYILYNRGMTGKRITHDMLPDDMSYEQKEEFIEECERRRKRSSWMLMFILAFVFTFAFDLLEFFVLPWLDSILK